MRKLIVAEHISLDGVIQGPGGPEEDPDGKFKLGGWAAPFDDEAIGSVLGGLMSRPFELLLGRRTYDIWAGYWPKVPSDSPLGGIADAFNGTAKHVATHRPRSLAWNNSHALTKGIAAAVAKLKKAKGPELHCWGSAGMLSHLFAAGLVDELYLATYPVVLGQGKKLFHEGAKPSTFVLVDSVRGKTGTVLNRYALGGKVRTGRIGGEV